MDNQRCRVLYIQKTAGGGSTISLFELVKNIDKKYFEPIIIFLQLHPYCERFKEIGVKTYIFKKNNSKNKKIKKRDIAQALRTYSNWLAKIYFEVKKFYLFFKFDLFLSLKIRDLIKQINPLIIHQNNNLPGNRATIFAGCLLRIPQICHVRMFHKLAVIDKILSRFVYRFIYISKAVERCYIYQKINKQKGKIIYNAVSCAMKTKIKKFIKLGMKLE